MKLTDYQNLALQTESPISGITRRHKTQPGALTSTEFRVLHSGLGIITELHEFINHENNYNLREELGDIFWFLALGYAAINIPFKPKTTTMIKIPEALALKNMTDATITILDWCKARTFYNRVEKNGKSFELVVKLNLDVIHKNLICIATEHKLDVKTILAENIAKLQARYPEKYSDTSANTRDYQKEQEAAENIKRVK